MSSERTERATPKRLHDARQRGQVPRSAELSAATGLLALVAFFHWYASYAVANVTGAMREIFTSISNPAVTLPALQHLGWDASLVFARVVAPLLAVALVVGVLVNVIQTGPVFSLKPLVPDFGRINPKQGISRILSKRGAFEAGKAMVKLAIIGGLTYPLLRRDLEEFAALTGSDPAAIVSALGGALGELTLRAGGAFFLLAVLDYGFQRWDFAKRMRMTRQEVREELRQAEGNPELKARIRRIQQQLARGRMMAAVPQATVVVTNPTHLAVALRYEPAMPAPIVIAKGRGHTAERVKALAREHAIPVVESKPLAQALYRMADVGAEVPVALYEAVADVIAYVYRLRGR